ncbi:MAG: DUF6527 family protein [Pseudomonadota bacterium]
MRATIASPSSNECMVVQPVRHLRRWGAAILNPYLTWCSEMKTAFFRFLKRLGLLKGDLVASIHPQLPARETGGLNEFILVRPDGVSKWAAFPCPGGCGQRIELSLNPNRRPYWRVSLDWWRRPTITPSVHQQNSCGCHFWVKEGRVDWCKGGRPQEVEDES